MCGRQVKPSNIKGLSLKLSMHPRLKQKAFGIRAFLSSPKDGVFCQHE